MIDDKNNKNLDNENGSSLRSVFSRVALRRMKEITLLEPALVMGLLMDIRELTGTELPALVAAKSTTSSSLSSAGGIKIRRAADDVRCLVSKEYRKISDENALPDKRRKSWVIVSEIFRLIDTLTGTDDDDDDSETNEHGIQTKPSASATTITASSSAAAASRKGSDPGTKDSQGTEKTQTSSNGKTTAAAPPPARDATQSSAATISSTTATHQKPLNSTTTASKNMTATESNTANSGGPKSAAQGNPSIQKKSPVRTVASLSSASAMTTATALESKNPASDTVNSNKNQSIHPSMLPGTTPILPPDTAPPPYQKRSLIAQQHKNQKLQKQGITAGGAPATVTDLIAAATMQSAVVSSSPSSISPTSSSSSNINNNSDTRPAAAVAKTLRIQFEPIPEVTEKPTDTKRIQKIWLPADDSRNKPTTYGCLIQDRPRVELQFNSFEPTKNMIESFKRRLGKWDPHWVADEHFCIGVTSPVEKQKYNRSKQPLYSPNTAACFDIKNLTKKAGPFLRQVNHGQQPMDNERRILIRMLPLYLSKEKDGGKHRADVHLWPKGTFMQIGLPNGNSLATPQILYQRKQQAHDAKKWLGICKHLDITSKVHHAYASTITSLRQTSANSTVELGCYESQLYMFSLALCRYQSPQTLCQTLLRSPMLRRVGLDEMQQRAKTIMESNEVVLDGDSDEDKSNTNGNGAKELKNIRFSIMDPLQLRPLQNPVRGRKCLHLSVSNRKYKKIVDLFLKVMIVDESHELHDFPGSPNCSKCLLFFLLEF